MPAMKSEPPGADASVPADGPGALGDQAPADDVEVLDANPMHVEHALSLLKIQLDELFQLQYFDPRALGEPSKRLANRLRPFRRAIKELDDFVAAVNYEHLTGEFKTISSSLSAELSAEVAVPGDVDLL